MAATFAHDEAGCECLCRTLVRHEGRRWSRSSGPTGCWSSGCWTRGCGCWRCIPTRSRRRVHRFRVSGGKSDRFDAFVLCELARTDHHRFRVLEPDQRSDQGAAGDDPGARGSRAAHGRHWQPAARRAGERFWPGPLGLFTDLTARSRSRSSSATPARADAGSLGEQRLQAFLAREHTPAARSPRELLAKLRRAPEGRAGELECRRPPARSCADGCGDQDDQRADQAARAADRDRRARAPRRSRSSCSLFKQPNSVITAANMVAEIGDCRARYPTRDALAADAGQAAVAIESGKRKARASAGRATSACATRSARSRTAPATGTRGPRTTTPRARARARPPARHPHPRPRLVPHRVAMLAGRDSVRPGPPPRPATPLPGDDPWIVGPPARPSRHPADARRRRHPKGGPQGRAQRA